MLEGAKGNKQLGEVVKSDNKKPKPMFSHFIHSLMSFWAPLSASETSAKSAT